MRLAAAVISVIVLICVAKYFTNNEVGILVKMLMLSNKWGLPLFMNNQFKVLMFCCFLLA